MPRDVVMARKTKRSPRVVVVFPLPSTPVTATASCAIQALADIVEMALLDGVGIGYELFAWVIMPNHVHVLIAPIAGNRLANIVQAWKSWTAKAINRRRRAKGMVWQQEYFDRFIRDVRHFAAALAYVENNPVKAGLAAKLDHWRCGSARRRAKRP